MIHVPELDYITEDLSKYERETMRTLRGYLKIAETFINLEEDSIEEIDKALAIYRGESHSAGSASGNSAVKFWHLLIAGKNSKDMREQFFKDLKGYFCEPNSKDYSSAATLTACMMADASKINQENKLKFDIPYDFRDGDSLSDKVRWSYLKIDSASNLESPAEANSQELEPKDESSEVPLVIDEKVYIHYTISHLMDQIVMTWIQSTFSKTELEEHGIDTHKDGFLSVITDTLSYKFTNGLLSKFDHEIINYWKTPRKDGGLAWIKQERIAAFQEAAKF